ncbi:hypothetical protein QX776_05960 [Alteromonadaceae bacterium BrNp21-10]|nr:hypothetical protein [Alteromonadaceae bacterium BrNp21-10]
MSGQQVSEHRFRSIFVNIIIVLTVLVLMATAISMVYHSEPDIKKLALRNLADGFSKSVINAHWQWRAEGRPIRILQIQYDVEGNERNRTAIPMSHLGWPLVTPTKQGCEKLWGAVLDIPMEVNRFQVRADFYDGVKNSDNALDSRCRFSLSTGPYFEYKVYTGEVLTTNV